MPLSVAIITKNEEKRISKCLESISFADEILVVDSGSSDNTVAVVKSFGCKVLLKPWQGYAKQKQFAVDNCANNWVLILDADERIPPQTADGIHKIIDQPKQKFSSYSFHRKNFFHNRWIRHCGWWPDRIVRLVDRRKGHFSNHLVHESWISEGEVKELDFVIEHFSFETYSDLIHKMEIYSSLAALEMYRNGKAIKWYSPITHGLWMFIRTYVLELGMLEGFDGFIISTLNSGGSFLKYAKLREIMLNKRPTNSI